MPGVALQQRQAGARGEVGGGECGAVSLVLGRCLGWNRIIVGGEGGVGLDIKLVWGHGVGTPLYSRNCGRGGDAMENTQEVESLARRRI